MTDASLYRAVSAACQLAGHEFGVDPRQIEPLATEAELACARCKAALLTAKLRRAGGVFSTTDDGE